MDAIRCKEWLIFRTGSLVGYNETARSRRLKPSPSALTLTCLQLYYLCARWLSGGFFYKVTWLPLFLYGAGVTLPSDPISGDSRKMDGARDLGMYSFVVVVVVCVCASFFFLPRCWYFSSRSR